MEAWPRVEAFIREAEPEFIMLQCGADSIEGDTITHMHYSATAYAHATSSLCKLSDEFCPGRMIGMGGGGGYNRSNIALAWTTVVKSMLESAGSSNFSMIINSTL